MFGGQHDLVDVRTMFFGDGSFDAQGHVHYATYYAHTFADVLTRATQPGAVYGPSAYRDEPLSEMRRTIARRLVTSLGPVPHFFLTIEIDMERAAELRRSINDLYPDAKVSVNDLIIKVAAVSLIQHPQVNASFQDKTVRYYEHADIGVAVATENGLITPIVRAAEVKSLLTEKHEFRTLVLDPITTVYNDLLDKCETQVGADFGRQFRHARAGSQSQRPSFSRSA